MKNKRGFNLLGESTVKILIAVICLIVLVGILTRVYFNYKHDEELEQAKATLDRLEKEINDIKKGETREIEIYSPKGWVLIGFSENSVIPDSCDSSQNCLCLCNDPLIDSYYKECNQRGTCIKGSLISMGSERVIKLENLPLNIKIKKESDLIEIAQ